MTRRLLPVFLLFLPLVSARPAQDPDAELAQKVRETILMLKNRVPALRQKAENDLVALGPSILPILREEESKLGAGELKQKVGNVIRRMERIQRKAIASGSTLVVTLSVKDRAILDVLEDLEKKTGVPIERKGIPGDALTSLEANGLSLWEAVDKICAAHGKLAWDVSANGIAVKRENYVRPFMATVSGYVLILRPFRRHPPGQGTGDRDYVRSDAWVAGPPGAISVAQWITFDALKDDKGANLLTAVAGLSLKSKFDDYRILAEPDMERPFYRSLPDKLDSAPARGSTKLATCKGEAVVQAVVELEKMVDIRGQSLKKGAKEGGGGLVLQIDSLDTTGEKLKMEVAVTDTRIQSKRERRVFYPESRGRIVLRDANGREIASDIEPAGTTTTGGVDGAPIYEVTRFKVRSRQKSETPLAMVEVWEATGLEEIKIPFDLKDVPMKRLK